MIGQLFAALRAGASLTDPAAWKQKHLAASHVAVLLGGGLALCRYLGFGPVVSDEDLAAVATGLVAVVGVLNAYLIPATTDKINVLGQRAPDPAAERPDDGFGPTPGVDSIDPRNSP